MKPVPLIGRLMISIHALCEEGDLICATEVPATV